MDHHPEKNLPERCAEVRAALPLYVGGDLEAGELAAVAAHLQGCSDCEARESRAQAARGVLASHAEKEAVLVTPSLWEGVRAGLVAEGLVPASAGPRPLAPVTPLTAVRRWWIGSGAAAAAVLFAFGIASLIGGAGAVELDPVAGTPGATPVAGRRADVPGTESGGATPAKPAVASEGLRHVGEEGVPLLNNAVDVLPEQGLLVRPRAGQTTLVRGRPLRKKD